jgi:hypothetical protein
MSKSSPISSSFHLKDLRLENDKDQRFSTKLQDLTKENSVMTDMLFCEATDVDKNKTLVRTNSSKTCSNQLNMGGLRQSPPTFVDDLIDDLDGRFTVYDQLRYCVYYWSIVDDTLEAMIQMLSTALFYGSIKDVEPIRGFAKRYPFKDGENVIDAGGSGSNCTSIWIVVWGDNAACGIYPHGSGASLGLKLWSEVDYPDGDGASIGAPGGISWSFGLSLRDQRAVVRICNIDVGRLRSFENSDEADCINLTNLLIKGKSMIPAEMQTSAVIYMNSDAFDALELELSDGPDCGFPGLPIRLIGAILSSEEALPARPVEDGSAEK